VADGIWEIAEGADALVTESGLTVIHVEQGTGKQPGRGSIVSVHYTGMLDDGTIFDSSYPRGDPFRFLLGQGRVIAGWDEGIALLRQGGRARLVIPPALGYGQTGAGGTIPPNATLIFDVLLVAVE
jgi:peptidylprolyl isomerase